MIKAASFEDEFFVVLTLQGKVLRVLDRIQRLIAEHYQLYVGEDYPALHITIDRIKKEGAQEAGSIIQNFARNAKTVEIAIEELDCYKMNQSSRFLVMDVVETESLNGFSQKIHKKLKQKGLSTIKNYEEWKYHITIVNNSFAGNPIKDEDFSELCQFIKGVKTPYYCNARTVEVWRPTLDPDNKVVESIKLPSEELKNMSKFKGFIFDLDGVITDTAEYHYQSWKRLADEEGIDFDREKNERLRGVSRRKSLEIILEGHNVSEEEIKEMMDRKNGYYQELINNIDSEDILTGADSLIAKLKNKGFKIAVASASKNARPVIENLGIKDLFEVISDGNSVENTKPAPDLFLHTAQKLRLKPSECVVIEDAASGIKGALRAGMTVIGVGPAERVGEADYVFESVEDIKINEII
ncbi:MAG: beta-phosphoglucomutase [Halanaerobium sp.]